MLKHKNPRRRGKFSLTRYFQKLKPGDMVAVVRELSLPLSYSTSLQGRTGKVLEKRGATYYVEIKDLNKPKRYLIHPIHLRRIQTA
ncbi:MAG TPA: 50S ribosomal protein L21e [Candidatus Nanoarchaeia archaeon]|nr:50S ribosomal protein L21e [Candidatus Nanoarchaeia archaeon]